MVLVADEPARARVKSMNAGRGDDAPKRSALTPYRRTIHSGASGVVEDFAFNAAHWASDSSQFQVVLPYAGLVTYSAGEHIVVIDVNQTVFVTPGEDRVEPLSSNSSSVCRSVIITPSERLLEEVCQGGDPAQHPAFKAVAGLTDSRSRLIAHKLLRKGTMISQAETDQLAGDAVRYALDPRNQLMRPAPSRVVDRARQLMHERDCQRMSLAEIACEVGVAPAYLTQEFTRCLGMPMYKYQLNLRLSRALIELPYCDSITELALALGFSSHSHFTAAFRAVFGITPSAFRDAGVRPAAEGK